MSETTQYSLINTFKGYVHKQDITNLPEGYLTVGSRNVLTNDDEKILVRKGFVKYEDQNPLPGGIQSCFDWRVSNGDERHMRGWQADVEILSVTTNTITKVGSSSWASLGYNTTGSVWIGGVEYTYTGGSATATLTGVSPDPSAGGVSAGDRAIQGSLQFLSGEGTLTPLWNDLLINKKSGKFNFATIYDATEDAQFLRIVNGESKIYEWSGGMTTFKSATINTLTKEGTNTWAKDSFYTYAVQEATITIKDYTGLGGDTVVINVNGTTTTLTEGIDWTAAVDNQTTANSLATAIAAVAGLTTTPTTSTQNTTDPTWYDITVVASIGFSIRNIVLSDSTNMSRTPDNYVLKQVQIGSIVYTYNGGEGTQTLTGVSPAPNAGGHAVGDLIFQVARQYFNVDITGLPDAFNNDLIANFRNQLYIGSVSNNIVYFSSAGTATENGFQDFSYSTPREVGEGGLIPLSDLARGFATSEDVLYIFAGNDNIHTVTFEQSSFQVLESVKYPQLSTAIKQGALSQSAIGKIKNAIVYVSNEKAFNQLGFIENILAKPQNVNLSDPIKLDFLQFNFTDASVFYFNYFIYIAVPREDIVLIFNIEKGHWESPQILPISCFSVINGDLYGHSSAAKQTYKLFEGFSDDGNPIEALALLSYQQFGFPANYKTFNEIFLEGYISPNTTLSLIVNYEIDGCRTQVIKQLNGFDTQFVCLGGDDRSLGKKNLGDFSLARLATQIDDRPPKFRWIPTLTHFDFYEVQYGFYSNGEDQRWEILRFGPNVVLSDSQNVLKKD